MKPMLVTRLAAFLAMLTLTAIALAQPAAPDLRAASYLAANCANCHGTAGRSTGRMPRLAGMPAATLAQSMRDFRDGKRPATLMHQLAKGYSDEQIDLMAAYFASQSAQ